MTKRRTALTDAVLADYVRECASFMGLRDWQIAVSSDPADEPENGVDDPSRARCATFVGTFGRKIASVWYNREYLDASSRDEVRQTTVHELVHALFHPTREMAIFLAGQADEPTHEVLLGMYDVTSEYAIDQLADLIAPRLPLPPA